MPPRPELIVERRTRPPVRDRLRCATIRDVVKVQRLTEHHDLVVKRLPLRGRFRSAVDCT